MTLLRQPTVHSMPAEPVVTAVPDYGISLVRHDGRVIGAYVRSGATVRYCPAVDPAKVLGAATAVAALAIAGVAYATATRRVPAVGAVTMGPGGWVSFKGGAVPPGLRPAGRRPWWARVLRARRLVVS